MEWGAGRVEQRQRGRGEKKRRNKDGSRREREGGTEINAEQARYAGTSMASRKHSKRNWDSHA